MTPEQQIRTLTIRVRELEEELAEWRRQSVARDRHVFKAENVLALQRAFRLAPTPARMLATLMNAAPGMVSYDRLFDCRPATVAHKDVSDNVLRVQMSKVKTALRQVGLGDAIRVIRNEGYQMDRAGREAIRARVGSVQP